MPQRSLLKMEWEPPGTVQPWKVPSFCILGKSMERLSQRGSCVLNEELLALGPEPWPCLHCSIPASLPDAISNHWGHLAA